MRRYLLAIDAGTTGIRVLLYDRRAQVIRSAYSEFRQILPKPGWVEHDAEEIWRVTARLLKQVVTKPSEIEAVGITNQRETVVVWDRRTGKPIHNAIVWQCRRTAEVCERLKREGNETRVRRRTGLVLDAYFSGTKLAWILDHVPGARAKARAGRLACGTIDTWLMWKLTGEHVTDFTNASRTMLFDIDRREWSAELCDLLKVPPSMLPEARGSTAGFGRVRNLGDAPIHGVAGDQQAALYGQLCHRPGMLKNTYGTGCFLVANCGSNRPHSKSLLTTLACDASGRPVYALEGSIFIAGAAVQWLRDGLKILDHAAESERLAGSIRDTGGVYLVPAFVGLGAPYWDMAARGTITGLTRGTGRAELVRAALESIAYQSSDVIAAVRSEAGLKIAELRVDGGATANNLLMQFQADVANVQVIRPRNIESTALGAAFLAGIGSGVWSPVDLKALVRVDRIYRPKMTTPQREALIAGWRRAVAAARLT